MRLQINFERAETTGTFRSNNSTPLASFYLFLILIIFRFRNATKIVYRWPLQASMNQTETGDLHLGILLPLSDSSFLFRGCENDFRRGWERKNWKFCRVKIIFWEFSALTASLDRPLICKNIFVGLWVAYQCYLYVGEMSIAAQSLSWW